jgi:hypothetical protein
MAQHMTIGRVAKLGRQPLFWTTLFTLGSLFSLALTFGIGSVITPYPDISQLHHISQLHLVAMSLTSVVLAVFGLITARFLRGLARILFMLLLVILLGLALRETLFFLPLGDPNSCVSPVEEGTNGKLCR